VGGLTRAVVEDALQQEPMQVSVLRIFHQYAQRLHLPADSQHANDVAVVQVGHHPDGVFKLLPVYIKHSE